jgi:ribosome-binding protein aMBF1 (putative translation factor)
VRKKQGIVGEFVAGGVEYVIVPKAAFLGRAALPPGTVDAAGYIREAIGRDLRKAREHAGLTQAELAKKLKRSQPLVASAESGRVRVGEKYTAAVLKACGLPTDWKG